MISVLLIEDVDEDANTFMLRWAMNAEKGTLPEAEFERATTLSEAIFKIERNRYTVVVLDPGLPDISAGKTSAVDIFHQIRKLAPTQRLVLNTGSDSESLKSVITDDPGAVLVSKSDPQTIDHVSEIVRLGKREMERVNEDVHELKESFRRLREDVRRQNYDLREMIMRSQDQRLFDQDRLDLIGALKVQVETLFNEDRELGEQVAELKKEMDEVRSIKVLLEYLVGVLKLLKKINFKILLSIIGSIIAIIAALFA